MRLFIFCNLFLVFFQLNHCADESTTSSVIPGVGVKGEYERPSYLQVKIITPNSSENYCAILLIYSDLVIMASKFIPTGGDIIAEVRSGTRTCGDNDYEQMRTQNLTNVQRGKYIAGFRLDIGFDVTNRTKPAELYKRKASESSPRVAQVVGCANPYPQINTSDFIFGPQKDTEAFYGYRYSEGYFESRQSPASTCSGWLNCPGYVGPYFYMLSYEKHVNCSLAGKGGEVLFELTKEIPDLVARLYDF